MMKYKKNIGVLICLLGVIAMLTGCVSGADSEQEKAGEPSSKAENSSTLDVPEDDGSTTEALEKVQEPIVIETKYGELLYPEQWEEFVRFDQREKDDIVSVTFRAEVNEKSYILFEVQIGGSGDAVGKIVDKAGAERDVCIHMEEIDGISELEAAEQDRLYAMQEDINYLIDNL